MSVMENLRKIRMQQNLTVKQLARKAHMSPSYLYGLENGSRTNPSRKKLLDLARALEVPLSSITD